MKTFTPKNRRSTIRKCSSPVAPRSLTRKSRSGSPVYWRAQRQPVAKSSGRATMAWKPIAAIHTPEYLEFLQNIFLRWQRIEGASEEVIPNIHPLARTGRYPASAVGQAGYHMADTACPISADTWGSACWSAWSAVEAAEAVLAGARHTYALCRPPGHHAFADVAGGFCFLNNSAIAAQHLLTSSKRVAILDVDLHHGNGTQGIFYGRSDVLTVSLHADPVRFYPFFWGNADERGEGLGLGYNYNLPLPRKTADAGFLEALDAANRRIEAYAPDALVVALWSRRLRGRSFWRTVRVNTGLCPHRRIHQQPWPADRHRPGRRLSLRRTRRQSDIISDGVWKLTSGPSSCV